MPQKLPQKMLQKMLQKIFPDNILTKAVFCGCLSGTKDRGVFGRKNMPQRTPTQTGGKNHGIAIQKVHNGTRSDHGREEEKGISELVGPLSGRKREGKAGVPVAEQGNCETKISADS
jgi:hypothetical protein